MVGLVVALIGCGDENGSANGNGGHGGEGGTAGSPGGLVFACTEQGLLDAIQTGGGPHTFACDGPTTVVTSATLEVDNDVTLDGEGDLTIDGDESHGVFRIPPSTTVGLRGMTITGGSVVFAGGGIFNEGVLTIDDCRIVENQSDDIAAAIYTTELVAPAALEIRNSEISGNQSAAGAAIFAGNTVTIEGSTVADNVGGGIDSAFRLAVRDSVIRGNVSAVAGGGISNSGSASIVGSLVEANEAVAGGGIFSWGGLSIRNSTVRANTADEGGGIYGLDAQRQVVGGDLWLSTLGLIEVQYSTLSNNSARVGGGVYSESLRLTAWNNTFSGNTATEEGGAFYIGGTTIGASTTTLTHHTIVDNTAPIGSAISATDAARDGATGDTPTVRLSGNILAGTCATSGSAVLQSQGYNIESPGDSCDLDVFGDIVDATPTELGLDPLADNGGETETHLPSPGSIAVDAVPGSQCDQVLPIFPLLDQRVIARPQGPGCDIGAVEAEP